MRKFSTLIAAVLMAVFAVAAMGQVRGKARLQGQVLDKDTKKPIVDAKVTVSPADGSTEAIVTKTNAKGRWSALGLTNGHWNVDIEAAGYQTSRGAANVSELSNIPPITVELAPEVKQVEEPVPVETAPSIAKEAVDAVNAGQDYMAQEKYKEAVAEFEKALPYVPDNVQLKQVLAQAYYKAGEMKKAIDMLEAVHTADASNVGVTLLLTNLYLENGDLDKGRATLATVPATAVTDPTVYLNIGILFLNKNNPSDAATYFAKAIDLDATRAESYYYRGLASLQMKKTAEAKADFLKVIALAPDSTEAKDAKQLVADLK